MRHIVWFPLLFIFGFGSITTVTTDEFEADFSLQNVISLNVDGAWGGDAAGV